MSDDRWVERPLTTLTCNFCKRTSRHVLVFGHSNGYCPFCGSNNLCTLAGDFAGPPPNRGC